MAKKRPSRTSRSAVRKPDKIVVKTPVTDRKLVRRSATGTLDAPCSSIKSKCSTQLVFDNGEAFLRFCTTAKAKGRFVPVKTPEDAARISREYCECVKGGAASKACAVKVGAPEGLRGLRVKKRRRRR